MDLEVHVFGVTLDGGGKLENDAKEQIEITVRRADGKLARIWLDLNEKQGRIVATLTAKRSSASDSEVKAKLTAFFRDAK